VAPIEDLMQTQARVTRWVLIVACALSRATAQLPFEAEFTAASTLRCEVRSATGASHRQTLPPGSRLTDGTRIAAQITGPSSATNHDRVHRPWMPPPAFYQQFARSTSLPRAVDSAPHVEAAYRFGRL
jgi:hypothetical protein